jgi:predicted nucleotidyltransferase
MKKLRNDDYLMEVTLRVGVRKKDAQAIVALTEPWEDDETEQDKVLSAVMDLTVQGLDKHQPLIEYDSSTAHRMPNLKAFRGVATFGERPRRPVDRKPMPTIESPLLKKRNKGKKISLETADRLFAGLKERLNRLQSYEEFGVSVPLVLLFGSYLRREPEVGDIDLAVLTIPRPNHEDRRKALFEAGRFKSSFMEELQGPQKEVLQFIKNHSSWLALHDFSEALSMKDLSFRVVYCAQEFRALVDRLERNELTGEEFLKAADEKQSKVRAEVWRGLREKGLVP